MEFEHQLGKLNAKWIITTLDEDASWIEHQLGKLNAKWIMTKLDEDASWDSNTNWIKTKLNTKLDDDARWI